MSGIDLNFGSKANPIKSQQKQDRVAETSLAKQLQFGTSDTQRVLATAAQQGNTLGASAEELQFLDDLTNASDTEIAAKYGRDVVLNRGNYLRQVQALRQDKSEGRTTGELVQDGAAGFAQGVGNMVLGAAELGASAYDWATEDLREAVQNDTGLELNGVANDIVAPVQDWFNETVESFRSDKNREQRRQYQLEQDLDRQDRDIDFSKQEDQGVFAQIEREIDAFGDTLENLKENPSQIFDITAEGIGSLGVIGKTVQAAAKANILRQMGKEAGEAFLKTEAGKAALATQAAKLVPALTAITEGGSSGLQARQEILSMPEQELMESPEYAKMIEEGLDPEEAKSRLADMAARPAALTGATIGLITGRIAARFEAAPMSAGSVGNAAVNVVKEGAEETIQEAGNQLATNVGVGQAGFDRSLVEGTGEGAATGLVGGVGTAGVVQAPGAALSATGTTARYLGGAAVRALDTRIENVERKRQEKDPVGLKALAKDNALVVKDAKILSGRADQTEAGQTEPSALQSKIEDALFVTPEKAQEYLQIFPGLEERLEADGSLDRDTLILALGEMVSLKELDDAGKAPFAIELMKTFDALRSVESNETQEAVQALEVEDAARKRYTRLARSLNKLESSPIVQKAQEIVANLDQAQIEAMFEDGLAEIKAGNLESDNAAGTIEGLQVISRYNPFVVPKELYDTVLQQVAGTNEKASRNLKLARDTIQLVEEAEASKAELLAEQDAAFEKAGLNENQKHRTKAQVREDILLDNNAKNQKLSVWNHRRKVLDSMAAGRLDDALNNAEELKNFAQSQLNKLGAFNRAAQRGVVNLDNGGETYQAYGNGDFFEQKGVWFNRKAPNSVALARDVHVDAQTVVGAYNALVEAYPELGLDSLTVPELTPEILGAKSAPIETDPVPAQDPERRIRSDAVVKASESLIDEQRSEVGERIKDSTKRKRAPYKRTTPRKRPLVDELIGSGITIDPEGAVGRELTALGIEKKDVPGLLKDGGLDDIDNIPFGNIIYLDEVIQPDDTGNYYDRQALLDAIISEAQGVPVQNADEIELSREDRYEDESDQTTPTQTEAEPETAPKAEPAAKTEAAPETEATPNVEREQVQSEASVETVETVETETTETQEPKTLTDALPDLYEDGEGRNHFRDSFKLNGNSQLLTTENTLETVLEASPNLAAKTKTQVKAVLTGLVPDLSDLLNKKLKEALDHKHGLIKGTRVHTWASDLADGLKDVLGYKNALSVNLTQKGEDGVGVFHPKVMEAATMAAVSWLVEAQMKGMPSLNDEKIAKRLGIREQHVSKDIRTIMESGPVLQSGIDQIAQNMMDLLGVSPDNTKAVKFTQGIFRSMAANMLELMAEQDLIDVNETKYRVDKGGITIYKTVFEDIEVNDQVTPNRTHMTIHFRMDNDVTKNLVEGLKSNPDIFKKALLTEYEQPFYVGEPPKSLPQAVLRQGSNLLSKVEKKVIKRLQSTPHRFVAPMVEFASALGDDVFMRLAGYKDYNEATTNKEEAERIKSRNRSIERGLKNVRTLMERTQAYANEHFESDVYAVDTFFDWVISSVGRLQQQGLVTPQGDKIAREMISATNSVLDLTNQKHSDALWLAVAQALDMSVEKKNHTKIIEEIQELIDSETGLRPAILLIREWVSAGEFADTNALETALSNARDKDGEPVEITVKALHALVTVARMKEAFEYKTEDVTKFETALALEADGKTDGPINAVINMGYGAFTDQQVDVMAKGGLFFTGSQMSLNQYIEGDGKWGGDKNDLYQLTAEVFQEKLKEIYSKFTPRTLNILDSFLPDFGFNGKEFEIGRGLVKNPLTVFLYGSGAKGIAGKMTGAVKAKFYETMTEIAEQGISWKEHPTFKENEQLVKDMIDLLGTDFEKMLKDPANFKFSQGMEEALTNAILATIGGALEESIDQTTGNLREAMDTIRTASQIQAIAFEDAYKAALEKGKDGRKAGDLSEKEYREIFEEVSRVAPIYMTDSQEFHIAASEKYSSKDEISQALSGSFASGSSIPMPAEVGVKIQPYLVIGTGDGKMILNIYNQGGAELGPSLPVFDGVEMALDKVFAASEQINENVWKGWQEESVVTTVLEGYNQFLRNFDRSKLSKEAWGKIYKLAKSMKVVDEDTGEVREMSPDEMFKHIENDLIAKSAENQARKWAMSQLNASIDHMAGANAPFVHKGEVLDPFGGMNSKMIAGRLNRLMDKDLARRREKLIADRKAPAVQAPTDGMMSFLKKFGTEIEGSDAVQISGSDLIKAVTDKNGFSQDQKFIFKDLLAAHPNLTEFSFIFGSNTELDRLRAEQFGMQNQKPMANGAMYPDAKLAFIANAAPETVLHEVVHVATADALRTHYADPSKSPEQVAKAIERLEDLMQTFETMQFNGKTAEDKAGRTLQGELKAHRNNPVAKMSEFLAWSLSNQNLIEAGKKQRVFTAIHKLASKTVRWLSEMLGIKSRKGRDMFSNIRFNAEVLIQGSKDENQSLEEGMEAAKREAQANTVFEQVYGEDRELSHLETIFKKRLDAALDQVGDKFSGHDKARAKKERALKFGKLMKAASKALAQMESNGFIMNQREKHMFMTIHASMMSGLEINPAAKRRAYELYSHMLKHAKPGTLGVLVGKGGIRKNADGQSDLLATFVALGLVHKPFMAELQKIEGPKNLEKGDGTVDGFLRQVANSTVNYLTQSAIDAKNPGLNMWSQLTSLRDSLAAVQESRRNSAERLAMKPLEIMDDKLSTMWEQGSKKLVSFIDSKRTDKDSPIKAGAMISAKFVAALGSKETTEEVAAAMTTMLNDMDRFVWIRETFSDLVGVTESNEPLMKLVNRVKSYVDALRQDYREKVPVLLAEKFSRKLKREEWTQLFDGIARTDLVVLGRQQSLDLLADMSKLPGEIEKAEENLRKLAGRKTKTYQEYANALAHYMVKREVISNNLLKNADAIARLLGESIQVRNPDPELVEAIDTLTSLYALDKVEEGTKSKLEELVQTEYDGMRFLIGYQSSTKGLEEMRLPKGKERETALLNGWKGYAPISPSEGQSLRVEDDSRHDELVQIGYERVGDYEGDAKEGYSGSRGYYQSTVGGRSAYRQGVAQTVHATFQGVDPRTGRTQTGEMAGVISGRKAKQIRRKIVKTDQNLPADTHLIPIYNEKGEILAYERTMDPEKRKVLDEDKHMGRMLGVWSGRIVEETQSDVFNKMLVQSLKDIYDKAAKDGDLKGFINVADPNQKDAVIRDAWDTMGWKLKDNAAELFGEKTLWIRKDMVNDALGFHQASVRDVWTGVSRWSPETQKAIRTAAQVLPWGDDAYKYLVKAESAVTDVVSMAKTTIVVRSLTVIWENLISNNLHLMSWGIGPIGLVKGQRAKFLEINQYVKNQERKLELTVELAANLDDPRKERRIKAELQALEDANKNLSIKPLLDAGEFSTVSESLTEQDQAIRNGKLSEYIDKAADKLPGALQTGFKNFVITKDTALFQGLNRAVQYGDFVAKAVLYDHLIQEKGYTHEQAMKVITEEFVNYNRLAGRDRDYLETTGMLWFFNYKIRIMKVMARMLRERPASALFYAGGVGPMADIDTVVSGSGLGAYLDNRLGYAIGPEMGYNGLFMNPWMNLTN